jgi:hypothetical protein
VPGLTRERIHQLAKRHRLDDHAVAQIIRIGATEPEFVEAVNRMSRGEAAAFRSRPMTRTVRQLCEVLASASDDLSEAD